MLNVISASRKRHMSASQTRNLVRADQIQITKRYTYKVTGHRQRQGVTRGGTATIPWLLSICAVPCERLPTSWPTNFSLHSVSLGQNEPHRGLSICLELRDVTVLIWLSWFLRLTTDGMDNQSNNRRSRNSSSLSSDTWPRLFHYSLS